MVASALAWSLLNVASSHSPIPVHVLIAGPMLMDAAILEDLGFSPIQIQTFIRSQDYMSGPSPSETIQLRRVPRTERRSALYLLRAYPKFSPRQKVRISELGYQYLGLRIWQFRAIQEDFELSSSEIQTVERLIDRFNPGRLPKGFQEKAPPRGTSKEVLIAYWDRKRKFDQRHLSYLENYSQLLHYAIIDHLAPSTRDRILRRIGSPYISRSQWPYASVTAYAVALAQDPQVMAQVGADAILVKQVRGYAELRHKYAVFDPLTLRLMSDRRIRKLPASTKERLFEYAKREMRIWSDFAPESRQSGEADWVDLQWKHRAALTAWIESFHAKSRAVYERVPLPPMAMVAKYGESSAS
jgi:hypothetical protein